VSGRAANRTRRGAAQAARGWGTGVQPGAVPDGAGSGLDQPRRARRTPGGARVQLGLTRLEDGDYEGGRLHVSESCAGLLRPKLI
jgi:hypothetical protein